MVPLILARLSVDRSWTLILFFFTLDLFRKQPLRALGNRFPPPRGASHCPSGRPAAGDRNYMAPLPETARKRNRLQVLFFFFLSITASRNSGRGSNSEKRLKLCKNKFYINIQTSYGFGIEVLS